MKARGGRWEREFIIAIFIGIPSGGLFGEKRGSNMNSMPE